MRTNRQILFSVIVGWIVGVAVQANDLRTYRNATLVESGANDGDSFIVQAGDQTLHLRLYFVDSPETHSFRDYDARRIQEQARYFGLDDPQRVIWLGRQAADFTKVMLSRPFTVHTAHAKALGGRSSNRIYGFVVTSTGRDLGELLVENGLARSFGVKRTDYRGDPIAEVEARLSDIEAGAMLSRRGIWQESNPEKLAEYRAQQRAEARALNQLMSATTRLRAEPLDINRASPSELNSIPGIGPVTASRIIKARPFTSVDDLRTVQGIGDATLEKIRPFIRIASPTNG